MCCVSSLCLQSKKVGFKHPVTVFKISIQQCFIYVITKLKAQTKAFEHILYKIKYSLSSMYFSKPFASHTTLIIIFQVQYKEQGRPSKLSFEISSLPLKTLSFKRLYRVLQRLNQLVQHRQAHHHHRQVGE